MLGVLVHCVLLLWVYENSGTVEPLVECPFRNADITKRVLFTIVRKPTERGPIKGMNAEFFTQIPHVYYYGESLIPQYYDTSNMWMKFTYQSTWKPQIEDSQNIFHSFKETVSNIKFGQVLFVLVVHSELDERNSLYIREELENILKMLNKYNGDNTSTAVLFEEEKKVIWSFGFEKMNLERKLERYEDLVPFCSVLFDVDIPYQKFARLPIIFFSSQRDKATGSYCNALNIKNLAENARQRIGLMKYLLNSDRSEEIMQLSTNITRLISEQNYNESLLLSDQMLDLSTSSYSKSTQYLQILLLTFLILILVSWLLLLSTEYIKSAKSSKYAESKGNYFVHILFFILALIFFSVPFVQSWPCTYHFFFLTPVFLFWLLSFQIKSFFHITYHNIIIMKLILFTFLLIIIEELIISEEESLLSLSICVVGLIPSLPVFRSVPFIFLLCWYLMSALMLSTTFFIKLLEPGTKYINLSATIWLILAGLSILWIAPKKDTVFTCFMALCLAIAMILQNACLTSHLQCYIISYCMYPLFFTIFVPFFGKPTREIKLIQCIFGLGVPVMLTSTTIEPITLLLLLGYTACWAALENYESISNWDNLRRSFALLFLFQLTEKLTATDPISFKCLICNMNSNTNTYLTIIAYLRLLISYCGVLCVFKLIIGSNFCGSSLIILASLVWCVGGLRLMLMLLFNNIALSDNSDYYLYQLLRMNALPIVMLISYIGAITYAPAPNNKTKNKTSLESIELANIN